MTDHSSITPKLPPELDEDVVFDPIEDELEDTLPDEPLPPSLLLDNLVPKESAELENRSLSSSTISFRDAMDEMEITSVFDIIRQPKPEFTESLARLSSADGDLAYDNAMCYAVQIGRLYREEQVSSDTPQVQSERNGVRALVDVGPSYPNLFKENWDEFCKVGDIAAIDSPVAYLSTLYKLATTVLEPANTGNMNKKVRLEVRRPDIKGMTINQQTTFTPVPMLKLANDVLSQGIRRYLVGKPDNGKPIHEVLAKQTYPFNFPYSLANHQCRLGLSAEKPELGEINYLTSPQLPITRSTVNNYGRGKQHPTVAQQLFAGLSPEQFNLLTHPSLFTTYYLSLPELINRWEGPSVSNLNLFESRATSYLLPIQPGITSSSPAADTIAGAGGQMTTQVSIPFLKNGSATRNIVLSLGSTEITHTGSWAINRYHIAGTRAIHARLQYLPEHNGNTALVPEPGYRATFHMEAATYGPDDTVQRLDKQSFTVTLDTDYVLTSQEQKFFQDHYGISVTRAGETPLSDLKTFMAHTGLNAEQVDALLSQNKHRPFLSPNCPSLNPLGNGGIYQIPYPHASHYGARYVNGTGADGFDTTSAASKRAGMFAPSMALVEVGSGNNKGWRITHASLNRLDRLQRMIRLQRRIDIPFAELDTLIAASIRASGESNLEMNLNGDALRILGAYRYLNKRYGIEPEAFAAFFHDLSPYATGDRTPMFDRVFNSPSLFDTPFVLDQEKFDLAGVTPEDQKTLYQLCAGLGLQLTETSLLCIARCTAEHVGQLRRSLPIVSSIYRQARIAQLFGLSVEEYWGLTDPLGGTAYQQGLATGKFRQAGSAPDIVDILMQMDWAVTWLKDSQQTVTGVRRRLGLDPHEFQPAQKLQERLAQLTRDTQAVVVTDQQIDRLDLPQPQQQTRVNTSGSIESIWFEAMIRVLDAEHRVPQGETVSFALAVRASPDTSGLPSNVRAAATTNIYNFLVDAHASQVPVTEQQLQALQLPRPLSTKPIDWRNLLSADLLDAKGLVKTLPLQVTDDLPGQLNELLEKAMESLNLVPADKYIARDKLCELLLTAHYQQQRLIEGLLQELSSLPMALALPVTRWAANSVQALLGLALDETQHPTLVLELQTLLRHAQTTLQLRLSASALRLFLAHPERLGSVNTQANLSLNSLYLLERYSHMLDALGTSEEAWLAYFNSVTVVTTNETNTAETDVIADPSWSALASLLNWNANEIGVLCKTLPEHRASHLAHVEWLYRCKQVCQATGLNAASVLHATDLQSYNVRGWQAMGEAVMATSH